MWHRVVFIPHVDFSAGTVTFSWGPYLTLVPGIAGIVASHWVAIGALATLAFPRALLVAWWFPETAGRTLDDIAPERA